MRGKVKAGRARVSGGGNAVKVAGECVNFSRDETPLPGPSKKELRGLGLRGKP